MISKIKQFLGSTFRLIEMILVFAGVIAMTLVTLYIVGIFDGFMIQDSTAAFALEQRGYSDIKIIKRNLSIITFRGPSNGREFSFKAGYDRIHYDAMFTAEATREGKRGTVYLYMNRDEPIYSPILIMDDDSGINRSYWYWHGAVYLFFLAFMPRITLLLFSSLEFGLATTIKWIFCPHILVAEVGSDLYGQSNPVLCWMAWTWGIIATLIEVVTILRASDRFATSFEILLDRIFGGPNGIYVAFSGSLVALIAMFAAFAEVTGLIRFEGYLIPESQIVEKLQSPRYNFENVTVKSRKVAFVHKYDAEFLAEGYNKTLKMEEKWLVSAFYGQPPIVSRVIAHGFYNTSR